MSVQLASQSEESPCKSQLYSSPSLIVAVSGSALSLVLLLFFFLLKMSCFFCVCVCLNESHKVF